MEKKLNKFNLYGKIALVSIPEGPYGKSATLALCEAGAKVYLASDDVKSAMKVVAEIKDKGYEVMFIEYDPANEKSIISLKDSIITRSGKLDIFVLNGGERFVEGWNKATTEELHKNLEKNQMGTMLITKTIGNEIAKNNAGSIIFLSSVYACVGPDPYNSEGSPEMIEYDFSLDRVFTFGGYINYARQASSYLGQFNVRVNTICAAPLKKSEKYLNEFAKRTTLLRNAKEEDIEGLVVYLASDASTFLTGTYIPVDGGYTAK